MNLDDDDSIFEQALRADLPTLSEQNRLRQRILAAGIAAGTALGTSNVAAATQMSFGASALSKLGALSWPAKLGLTAMLAAPVTVAALPLVYRPVAGAALVSQVRRSTAAVRAQSVPTAARLPSNALPLDAVQLAQPAPEPAPEPEPEQTTVAARASVASPTDATPSAVSDPPASANASAAAPTVAAFDSVAREAAASGTDPLRNSSTLAAETQLLDRAFAALAAGDSDTAAALVAEHTRRFPRGLLRQERERARARLAQDPKGE